MALLQAKNHSEYQVKQEFVGLSTDTKPTLAQALAGSTFYATDTAQKYIWNGAAWRPVSDPVAVTMSDSGTVDAFGRVRTGFPFGIFDNKNIVSSNQGQWEEIIYGLTLTYTGLIGTFQVGEEVRGATSPIPISTVLTDNGATMRVSSNHNFWVAGGTITGQTSGATATIATVASTGPNISYQFDRASVLLSSGTTSGDYVIRSTHRYNAYVPGKSQLCLKTFILGTAQSGVVQRVGLFDNYNGLFVEQTATDIAFVVRSNTSGSVVDTRYIQSSWNLDKLDGTGDSGVTLDASKEQIFVIDFQWLGVGRVRFGFDIDGIVIYTHEVLNANNGTVVYMRTPTLPVRYEVRNTGTPASAGELEEICSSVISEGGYSLPGLEYSVAHGITRRAVTTRVPIMALRCKTAFPTGKENRRTAKFLNAGISTSGNDAFIEVAHAHDPYDITATWTSVNPSSGMEYSTDISAVSAQQLHILHHVYAVTATANKASVQTVSGEFTNLHGYIAQNFDSTNSQMFIIFATSMSGTADVAANISWVEFD